MNKRRAKIAEAATPPWTEIARAKSGSHWIWGDGPFAVVCHCGGTPGIYLHPTESEGRAAFEFQRDDQCGSRCNGDHEFWMLDGTARVQVEAPASLPHGLPFPGCEREHEARVRHRKDRL
jgi:hypothetical protein